MSLPSATFRHYRKRTAKLGEPLSWQGRIWFIFETYNLFVKNEPKSKTEIKQAFAQIAHSFCFLYLTLDKYLSHDEKQKGYSYIDQMLKLLDQSAIDVFLIANKSSVHNFTQKEFPILLNRLTHITKNIEALLTKKNLPLHTSNDKLILKP
jgi:hypothetical protein